MFKRLRIAFLLYVLLFVAAAQFLAERRSTDWDATLWVLVHPVNGDGKESTQAFVERWTDGDLQPLEAFLAREAARYGIKLDEPVRFELAPPLGLELPQLDAGASLLGTAIFSLRLRWAAVKANRASGLPSPDVTLFAVLHDGRSTPALDRSLGLRKGLVAVANLFTDRSAVGSNHVVIAHEVLHTLGATDKYDLATLLPRFPEGYADPEARPRLPQRRAELMGGRIAISGSVAEIPHSLRDVVIGPVTAREIGWIDE